ncbi:alpha-2-macroglobulin family protein [Shimia biformata]|uniref:alpha-2-macroglobulin family protein n=1 Tax=Shimia biformata TaxID=1294299 RepID=UPI00194DF62B|nr:alpha-2-macroglobulin family protein [Shimia biformata]
MRWIVAAIFGLVWAQVALAQDSYVPERRAVVSMDVDFYGSDLQNIFDTTYEACRNACIANADCGAFTFNTKASSCFPKRQITEKQPYEGAVSAEIFATDPAYQDRGVTRAADLGFLGQSTLTRARNLARDIGWIHAAGPWSVEDMLEAARDRTRQNDTLNAMRWTGGAVAKADRSDLWTEYARLNGTLAIDSSKDKRRYRDRWLLGAVNGYLRAASAPQQVAALLEMGLALEASGRGRDMLRALRLAEQIQPRDDVVALLDDAIGKYGFRITEHSVESDPASPRICAEFSEDLVKAGVDYAPYVRLPDQRFSVQAEGRQICIEGVEHGKRYTVTFREGLPSASGEALIRDVDLAMYVRDREPSLRFPGRTYVLPRTADAGLPIETVNLDTVALHLRRVSDRNLLRAIQNSYFGRPMSYWQLQDFSSEIAESVWQGEGTVENTLNQDMTTRLPMGEVIADLPAGVYALTADLPGASIYDETSATQWFVLSDIGATTLLGADGLHVFARALSDAAALEGTKVTLLSRANRVLGEGVTDAEGYARFEGGLTRGTGAKAPALVMLETGDDFTFLSLTDPAFDLSDRGVEGREPAGAVDLFLATDRGAYRAGETIHATVLARDGVSEAIASLPLTAILTRPDGVEYSRHLSHDDVAGGHVFTLPVGATVPRGAWVLDIKSDVDAPPLVSRKLLVEDFLPERIDFDLTLPDVPVQPGGIADLTVASRYLFGAPGAGLAVNGRVTLRADDAVAGFEGYRFGRHDELFSPRTEFFGSGKTDAQGVAEIPVSLPDVGDPGRPLKAEFIVEVAEGSGRPVERKLSHPVAPAGDLIGIRPMFDGVVPEGAEATFRIAALDRDLNPASMKVKWTVNRVRTHYQWYMLYGDWNWEPVTQRSRVATGEVMLTGDPVAVSAPVEWGQYEIVVERIDGDYVAASTDFYAGWYAPADASDTPDTLELSLDKPAYHSGDTAMLRIVPRNAGTALVQVMSNRLIAMKAVEVVEGENLIPLEVTDDWGAGAYVTASVIRPMDEPAGRNPGRALGLSYASVDPGASALSVTLDAPQKIAPRGVLDVSLTVDGITAGETAYVTLAAVDVGILNLTGFQSPDPSGHYFGQRRLGMEIRDIYGRLIDGMNGATGAIRSGGDAASGSRFDSPPPTEELVAFFKGPVEVGVDGKARVSFDIPQFNGTVRLMAIAWSPTGVGQAEADVLVRDPVVVTASLPRFLAPGDQSRMLLEIVHAEGPTGRMGLDVSGGVAFANGAIPSGVELGAQGTVRLSVPITAPDVGDYAVRIALTTPDGKQLVKDLLLPVRANDPEVSTTQRLTLASGDTFRLDDNLFADLRAGSGSAIVSTGALARFDAPGLLAVLDRYPYGCTEQVTSKAMPLLYFDTVAQALGLASGAKVAERIDQAIARVLTRQASNGAFGLWYADSGDFWLDAYVSDFLSRARAKGYDVPQIAFRQAMDNLRNRINYAPDFDEGGEDIAYALLVLAREGAANMGDLRYYADVKAEAFSTPLAAAQLGAALASYGDQTRADRMFARAQALLNARIDESKPIWRVDYGTALRDSAAVLTLAVESGSDAVDRGGLVQRLTGPGRGLSTQESAWSLIAAHALLDDSSMGQISVNGAPVEGPLVRALADDASLVPLDIRNTSDTATDLTITTIGVPDYKVQKGGNGYAISRRYYDMSGVEVAADSVRTGDRMVVVLKVEPFGKTGARLMVNDPLPAGLEIDNPNLLSTGDVDELNWLKLSSATFTEFRSDRFLAAVDWRGDKPFQLAYIVRAVSPGSFHHPAASVEDMYRPQFRARTDSGRITVTE